MAVTQLDIAKACGVSYTTVNFVLNGRARQMNISDAVIARVTAEARKLGYARNYHASTLATGKANTIGLLVQSSLNNLYWSTIAEGIDKAAQERGYDVLILTAGRDEPIIAKSVRFIKERRIDALIAIGGYREYTVKAAVERKFPVVAIEVTPKGLCPEIRFDSRPGIDAAVRHLHEHGHRRILWLDTRKPDGSPVLREREDFLVKSAEKLGIRVEMFHMEHCPNWDDFAGAIQHYYNLIDAGLSLSEGVTAIMCYNDTVAAAANYVLARRGIRVPTDMSLVGFDDLYAAYCVPALTTISHRLDAMGSKAVELLLKMIEGEAPTDGKAVADIVPSELVVRQTVAQAIERQ